MQPQLSRARAHVAAPDHSAAFGTRVERLEARRERAARTRRRRSTLTGLVLALLVGATIVSTAALANPDPAPNSVVAGGRAPRLGAESGLALRAGVVGIAGYPTRPGYWLVGADGGVFAFGHAPFLGSLGDRMLNAPIVGIAATPHGKGYWLAGSDGGVFAFGDAKFYGSLGGPAPTAALTPPVAPPRGHGKWAGGEGGGGFSLGGPGQHRSPPPPG